MFGMTKKQFLKKSKKCLKDIGIELLLIREITYQETNNSANFEEAYQKMEKIRKTIEEIFFQYETLKAPTKCKKIQLNLLSAIIILQESVVANIEYINLLKNGLKKPAREKFKKSIDDLEKFRETYRTLSQEVDLYLKPK